MNHYPKFLDQIKINKKIKLIPTISIRVKQNMDEETIWRDISGYEGNYKISSNGDIFSNYRNCLMKQQIVGGYKRVHLSLRCISKSLSVHILVAVTFIPINNKYVPIWLISRLFAHRSLLNFKCALRPPRPGRAHPVDVNCKKGGGNSCYIEN